MMLEFDQYDRHIIPFPKWLNFIVDLLMWHDWKDLERRAEITGQATETRQWGPDWCCIKQTRTVRKLPSPPVET